jgi:hypothetical protein
MKARGRGLAALLLTAVLAAALAASFLVTPKPLPADAPADRFAAGRALADIAVIAREPHPVGSPANARVRDHLLARMTALGLAPQLRPAETAALWRGDETHPVVLGGRVENIVGVLPGRDRSAPAVAIVAHYDSAPGSPGAGDDGAGVATALEVARVLKARGPPARDVFLLVTDGEEPGLLGAEAFFRRDPLAARIHEVINLEARGGAGRAIAFETGASNGGIVRALAGAAHAPLANSAAVFIYRRMPNATDFTVAKAVGKTGVNFAFLGRQFDYHAPTATLANLEPGAVQSMGDEVLPLVARLASGPPTAPEPDRVFSQLFGSVVLSYPPAFGWALLALAAVLLVLAARRSPEAVAPKPLTLGALAAVLAPFLAAALLWAARQATGIGFGFLSSRALLARPHAWEAAEGLLVLLPLVLLARFCGRRAWLGLLATVLVFAAAAQIAAPLAAYLLAWPLVIAAALALATRLGEDHRLPALGLLAAGAGAVTAWLVAYFHFAAQALDLAPALAVFTLLAAPALWPLLGALERRTGAVLALALLVGAVAVVGWLRFAPAWSERHPRATAVYYVADTASGAFYRAAPFTLAGPWSEAAVRAGDGTLSRKPVQPLFPRALVAAARPVAMQPLAVTLARTPDGRVHLRIPWRPDLASLTVELRSSVAARDPRIGGQPVRVLARAGVWNLLDWGPSRTGIDLDFLPSAPGRLELRYGAIATAWPADAAPPPPRDRRTMAWGEADRLAITGAARLFW